MATAAAALFGPTKPSALSCARAESAWFGAATAVALSTVSPGAGVKILSTRWSLRSRRYTPLANAMSGLSYVFVKMSMPSGPLVPIDVLFELRSGPGKRVGGIAGPLAEPGFGPSHPRNRTGGSLPHLPGAYAAIQVQPVDVVPIHPAVGDFVLPCSVPSSTFDRRWKIADVPR